MNRALLVRYIQEAVDEAKLARVPNQLIDPEDINSSEDDDQSESVNEFSGVGSIGGYSAPLGMDPDRLGRQKNSRKKK